ncbi:metallophosphoesterase family protein [soil metagenome]
MKKSSSFEPPVLKGQLPRSRKPALVTRRRFGVLSFLGVLLFFFFSYSAGAQVSDQNLFEPVGLLLTWERDPTSTMVIDFHTSAGSDRRSRIEYRPLGTSRWKRSTGQSHPFPHAERTIHRVRLRSLRPGTTYEFRMGKDSRTYRFRTMPKDGSTPVRFITGGDTMHDQAHLSKTNRAAMRHNPDFLVWGGDFAYANGDPKNVGRWILWFDSLRETLIDQEGRVVPVVAAIGNHEVRGGMHTSIEGYQQTDAVRANIAPFFHSFFSFPGQPGYGALDFGNYLSLVLLDTDHTNPMDGAQAQWLEKTLSARQKVAHVFPVYHVPAYPSHRPYEGRTSQRVREHFVPLFEKHGIRIAFENHDHAYKRTHPLRNGKVVAEGEGIVYIGDGAWGVGTREVREEWYLNNAKSVRHFILVTITGSQVKLLMVDEDGNVIDEYGVD